MTLAILIGVLLCLVLQLAIWGERTNAVRWHAHQYADLRARLTGLEKSLAAAKASPEAKKTEAEKTDG